MFVFVLDTALNMREDGIELEKAKDALQQALQTMPGYCLVGFVTFGQHVFVHEIGFSGLGKAHALRGDKPYSGDKIAQLLRLRKGVAGGAASIEQNAAAFLEQARARFLVPVSECEFVLSGILDDLSGELPQGGGADRVSRCTGAALGAALGVLENLCPQGSSGGRVMLLTSGPCTRGPGQVVDKKKSVMLRSHYDLQRDLAPFAQPAKDFYRGLAKRAVLGGPWGIDVFACSLDQCGTYEMRILCDRTGGMIVLSDSFSMHVFSDTFLKLFRKTDQDTGLLQMGFSGKISVRLSAELRVSGVIGACTSLEKRHPSVGGTEIGEARTVEWTVGVLDKRASYAFYFEKAPEVDTPSTAAFVQFQTQYLDPAGRRRLRVTTCSRWEEFLSSVRLRTNFMF